jgi:thioredoxin-like negative regulator of GroEL
MMSSDPIFNQAIQAIQAGQTERARDLLTRVLKENPQNSEAWLWMSAVVTTKKEQVYCLQQVLRQDPDNPDARQGLILLGAVPADDQVLPAPVIRRKWEISLVSADTLPDEEKLKLKLSRRQMVTLGGAGVVVVTLMAMGVFGATSRGWSPFRPRLTVTPLAWSPTPTVYVSPTPSPVPSATPTYPGPTPLSMLLEATYTPTPLYVGTPHPISEAFRSAMRAFQRGDMEQMRSLMQQAAEVEPEAPDIPYYIGESYLQEGEYQLALDAYNQSIQMDSNFAPAYLGRARANQLLNPSTDVKRDLDLAIQNDGGYAEAYLARAAYLLDTGEDEAALEDLQTAEELLPGSPLVYLYRAQALLALGEPEAALEAAQTAYKLDLTIIPVYFVQGEALLANDQAAAAVPFLKTYT